MSFSSSIVESANCISCKYAYRPRKSNRNKLLNTPITKIFIVIEPFGNGVVQIATAGITQFLPAAVSTASVAHASIWVPKENSFGSRKGICIEYGGYDERREGDYEDQVHYYSGTDGLRFMRMTADQLSTLKTKGYDGLKIPCEIMNPMTVGELLRQTSCYEWKKGNYDMIFHNCQTFVSKCVQVLGAYRTQIQARTLSKVFIPFKILNCLEKNEDNRSTTTKIIHGVEKIPFFGTLFGLGFIYGGM
ncbi:hypothetical protein GPJ56_000567 [Histomonas meleagridis]|uniref:uncharacterized protein n=1 Tax=Histomonas meleagridis TaxID=135588 RepID=UPI00355968EC|nr:hypothetical protein GPJ56_000567 [Histomonas meleagridis]KAH0796393.1 hypothetical protein GO595_010286 [Histomonas meleagridis]